MAVPLRGKKGIQALEAYHKRAYRPDYSKDYTRRENAIWCSVKALANREKRKLRR